jgi:hypothetical protein
MITSIVKESQKESGDTESGAKFYSQMLEKVMRHCIKLSPSPEQQVRPEDPSKNGL